MLVCLVKPLNPYPLLTYGKTILVFGEEQIKDNNYLMADNEILFLFHEESIKLLDLIVQQVHKLLLSLPILKGAIQQCWSRRNQSDKLLQFLVRQKLVPPTRQRFLNLLFQPFPELHRCNTTHTQQK